MDNNYLKYEEKKAFLSAYLEAVRREKEIIAEIHYLEDKKMFPINNETLEIHKIDDYPEYKILIDYQIRLLKDERMKSIQCYTTIEESIRGLEDENEQRVLRLIYIKGMKGEDVAEAMSYSIRQIRNIQKSALEKLLIKSA